MSFDEDVDGDLGPLDEFALDGIRQVFGRQEPLVTEAGFPHLIDPRELRIHLEKGIDDADEARFGIRWFGSGYYSFHYTDDAGRDFRWDYHPKKGAPDKHFHPLPNPETDDPEPSCITVEQPELVARAAHKLWRRAFDRGSHDHVNTADNPP